MKIGIIGAGAGAKTIAKHALPLGHEVMLSNTRGPGSLARIVNELGPGVKAGTPQQAADQDIVILAVGWPNVQQALFAIAARKDKTLIDATNRIASMSPLSLGDVSGRTASEIMVDLAPSAKVVKAFNSVPMNWISDFSADKQCTVLFISGDNATARKPVYDLIESAGLFCVDLGSLATGGRLQQLGGPLAGIRLTLNERLEL